MAMDSSKSIISSGKFRPNKLMKAQLWEDQKAASEGKLGLTQAQKEQMAQEGAAAAATQAAQTQTEISRSMMGQPDFVGQKAQLSAAATEAATAQGAAGMAAANQASQNLAAQKKAMIDQRLAAAGARRYNTGMFLAQTGIGAAKIGVAGLAGGTAGATKAAQNSVGAAVPYEGQ